jgi:hypothetical protein
MKVTVVINFSSDDVELCAGVIKECFDSVLVYKEESEDILPTIIKAILNSEPIELELDAFGKQ